MNEYPSPGAYAIDDPHQPWRASYWTVGDGLRPWPTGAQYGPPRPPRKAPGGSLEQRRDEMKLWRAQVEEYRLEVLKRIAADPAAAAARFTRQTERCASCRCYHRAEDLPESAAGRRDPTREPLTAEQRRAMVADLRRAGHPEKLIAQFLGISPGTVNKDARRSGIGAPLEPRPRAQGRHRP